MATFRTTLNTSLAVSLALFSCHALPPNLYAGEIHELLEKGQTDLATALLAKDPGVIRSLDDNSQNPLHIAAARGQAGMVKLLLGKGAGVNDRAYNQFTPLHLATDPGVIRLLIAHKADIEAKASIGRTVLQGAAENNDRRKVRLLLAAGAFYDIRSAVLLGDLARVQTLLKKDPRPARDNEQGLLHYAAREGHAPVVRLLLAYQADVNNTQGWGVPPLVLAVPHPAALKALLDGGADAQVRDRQNGGDATLLHDAAEIGQVESAKLLIEAGIPVDARAGSGATALHCAAWGGHDRMVRFLLGHNADINARTAKGHSALVLAAMGVRDGSQGHAKDNARFEAVIDTLHARGVPIDLYTAVTLGRGQRIADILKGEPGLADDKGPDGKPLLHRAVDLDRKEGAAQLLDSGAKIDATDEDGYTALHAAAFWGREELARLLIKRGADVNAVANGGTTPLHESARLCTPGVARLLVAAGAKVNAKDREGSTPLSWAAASARRWAEETGSVPKVTQEMVEVLRRAGGVE
jgi:cytohesin